MTLQGFRNEMSGFSADSHGSKHHTWYHRPARVGRGLWKSNPPSKWNRLQRCIRLCLCFCCFYGMFGIPCQVGYGLCSNVCSSVLLKCLFDWKFFRIQYYWIQFLPVFCLWYLCLLKGKPLQWTSVFVASCVNQLAIFDWETINLRGTLGHLWVTANIFNIRDI